MLWIFLNKFLTHSPGWPYGDSHLTWKLTRITLFCHYSSVLADLTFCWKMFRILGTLMADNGRQCDNVSHNETTGCRKNLIGRAFFGNENFVWDHKRSCICDSLQAELTELRNRIQTVTRILQTHWSRFGKNSLINWMFAMWQMVLTWTLASATTWIDFSFDTLLIIVSLL